MENRSPRLTVVCERLLAGAIAAMISTLALIGCSSTTPPSASPSSAAEPVPIAKEPPLLELCPLPALAPADLRSKPGYVEFAVSAIDANGVPTTGLKPSDFIVHDGAHTYPIAYFRHTSAKTPVSLVIVGDTSTTMFNKTVVKSGNLSKIRARLDKGAEDINECDEIAVVLGGGDYAPGFNPAAFDLPSALSGVTLLQPFTTDHADGLMKMENVLPSGANRLPDEIRMAVAQLGDAHYPDRALVIMTDGLDPNAIEESAPLLEQARAKGIGVWVIGSGDPDATTGAFSSLTGTSRVDVAAVKRLAAAGGAEVLFAQPVDKDGGVSLAQAVSTIGKQLGQGYAIGVTASSANPRPAVALAKPADGTLRAAVVPSQVLADAATRHPPPPQPDCIAKGPATPPPAISSKPGYTQVRVTVVDPDGNGVRGLKQSDFTAASDSASLPIVYLHEDSGGVPRSLVITIDTSGSMQPKLDTVRRELGKLLKGLNPCDEVALVAFSSRVFLLQEFTTNHHLVERRLTLLHPYGPTALYDAIDKSLKILSKAKYQDRVLVLLTDGMDNVSQTSKNRVLTKVAREHVQIYAIGIGQPMDPGRSIFSNITDALATEDLVDKETLDMVALRTGGMDSIVPAMTKDQGKGFTPAITTVQERLENGYEIGFVAATPGTTPTISVTNHPDYVVRIVGAPPAPSESITAAPPSAVSN